MGTRYLIDTNVLIEYQMNALPQRGQGFVTTIIDNEFNISIVNKIEMLGSKNVSAGTEQLLQLAFVFNLNEEIVNMTILLRKQHKIKLPDAIIAATVLIHGLTLITRNVRDFIKIGNLKVVNPHDI